MPVMIPAGTVNKVFGIWVMPLAEGLQAIYNLRTSGTERPTKHIPNAAHKTKYKIANIIIPLF
jgi:hypothetical protein